MKEGQSWTTPQGIRCTKHNGEVLFHGQDLAKFILTIDPEDSVNPATRENLRRFHQEAPLLNPAGQLRLALELFDASAELKALLLKPRGV